MREFCHAVSARSDAQNARRLLLYGMVLKIYREEAGMDVG